MSTAAEIVPPTPSPSDTYAEQNHHTAETTTHTDGAIPPLPVAEMRSASVHTPGALDPPDGEATANKSDGDVVKTGAEGSVEAEYDGSADFSRVTEWASGEGYIYDDPDAESTCVSGWIAYPAVLFASSLLWSSCYSVITFSRLLRSLSPKCVRRWRLLW